jgi:predicted RNase H-like HicB family nuclease
MKVVKIVYWHEGKAWHGHLQDYPDYWTQGKTLRDLKDLYRDIASGEIPSIRKVEELIVS